MKNTIFVNNLHHHHRGSS